MDKESITVNRWQFLAVLGKRVRDCYDRGVPNLRVVFLPYWLMRGIAAICNSINPVVKRVPRISQRRLAYLYRDVEIHCEPIGGQSGWYPGHNILERLRAESK